LIPANSWTFRATAEAPVVTVITPEVTVNPSEVVVVPGVVEVNVPEQPVPIVNVQAAEAPVVNVHVPEHKPVTKTIKRDKKGAITHIEES
jgi:hypothetical protein